MSAATQPQQRTSYYPHGGFLWNDGNVVTTTMMRVDHESLRMSWPAKCASTAEVNSTNAG
jgi:hypothetical protein